MVAGPIEQVLDEVEQGGVGPLEVLEHHHQRPLLGQSFEQDPPCREQRLLVAHGSVFQPEEMAQTRLGPPTFLRVGDVLLQRGTQLGQS